jgi:putative spermidine/putrescine transport system substrate-binding protein
VVFQSLPASSSGLHGFLMFNRIQGGTDKNVDPGFAKWASTPRRPRRWTSSRST